MSKPLGTSNLFLTSRPFLVALLFGVAAFHSARAQEAAAPAAALEQRPQKETPRPQDLEPAVNTSAPAPPESAAAQADPSSPAKPAPPAKKAPAAAGAAAGRGSRAVDHLNLETTEITGNRELPKVLYIVPWKRSDLGDLVGKPVNSLLDEVLEPVDREVFRRENRYYRALQPDSVEATAPAAPK